MVDLWWARVVHHAQKQTMLHILSIADAPQTVMDILSGNNFFAESVGAFFCAIFVGVAVRLKLTEWKAMAIFTGIIIIIFIIYALIATNRNISWPVILIRVMPTIAIVAWMLSASYFRSSVNKSITLINESLIKDIERLRSELRELPNVISTAIQEYHDTIHNPYKENTISFENRPVGQITHIDINLRGIMEDLASLQLPVRREYAKKYLGNFVIWELRISDLRFDDESISIILKSYMEQTKPRLTDLVLSGIMAKVIIPVSSNPKLKLMKNGDDLIVEGRICELCVQPFIVTMDNVTIKETS